MHIEYYIKARVDHSILNGLSSDKYERFLTKAAIEISRDTSPKQVFNLSRAEVREMVHEVLKDYNAPKVLCPTEERFYSCINGVGEAVYAFAKTKKQANELFHMATSVSPRYWCKHKTLRKVVGVTGESRAIMEDGESRELGNNIHFINAFGHGEVVV